MDWKVLILLACVDIILCVVGIKDKGSLGKGCKYGRNVFEFFLYVVVIGWTLIPYFLNNMSLKPGVEEIMNPFVICISVSGMCDCLEKMFQNRKDKE